MATKPEDGLEITEKEAEEFAAPKTLRDKLRNPLPATAIKQHPTKKWSSSINGAFIIERLNDVFGEGGWLPQYEIIESRAEQKMVVLKTRLYANSKGGTVRFLPDGKTPDPNTYDIYRETFGGNDNPDRGDAYKGACTDGLGKACSQLGIAGEVYKGMLDEVQAPAPEPSKKDAKKKFEGIIGLVTEFRNISPESVYLQVNNNGLWIRTLQVIHADRLRKSLGCKIEITAFWDKGKTKKNEKPMDLLTVSAVHAVYESVPRTEFVPRAEDENQEVRGIPINELE